MKSNLVIRLSVFVCTKECKQNKPSIQNRKKTKSSGHVVVAAAAPMPLVAIHSISCKGWALFFVYSAYPESGRSSQTRFFLIGETAQLNCSIQPGRARSLYSPQWTRNNVHIATTFSLSVPVRDVSQNGTIYQCTVIVRSCSPISRCPAGNRIAEGDSITLVVGGECTLYCKSKLSNIGILGTLLQGNCDPK